mmetsp:Transcript_22078/g.32177  ORF Transcript_22078/g.32177 Transcript_22078/m.32177 type:complete len:93 (+) Transcript_22078:116-394(+)
MGEIFSNCIFDNRDCDAEQRKFRVVGYNGATVRADASTESRFITKLPQGSVVIVDDVKERRVHICSPVIGWTSIHTNSASPLTILQPIDGDE